MNREPPHAAAARAVSDRPRWLNWFPGLAIAREYDRSWLRHDIVAGLVLTTMLVPVGIAYAEASGGPGIYGLYATIVPMLAVSSAAPTPTASVTRAA